MGEVLLYPHFANKEVKTQNGYVSCKEVILESWWGLSTSQGNALDHTTYPGLPLHLGDYPRNAGPRGRNPLGPEWAGSMGPCRSPVSGGGAGRRCATGGMAEGMLAASAASCTAAPGRDRDLAAQVLQSRQSAVHAHTLFQEKPTQTEDQRGEAPVYA